MSSELLCGALKVTGTSKYIKPYSEHVDFYKLLEKDVQKQITERRTKMVKIRRCRVAS